MATKSSTFEVVKYDYLTWKPVVKKSETHDLWYVSRRRKKYDAEYLNLKAEWQDWAEFFPSEAEAEAAKQKAYDNWKTQYNASKAKHDTQTATTSDLAVD